MHELIIYSAILLTGIALGLFFYQGLWWTTKKGLTAKRPALWFLGSNIIRTGTVLTGFYLVSAGQWQRMVICLLGFVLARLILFWLQAGKANDKMKMQTDAHHS